MKAHRVRHLSSYALVLLIGLLASLAGSAAAPRALAAALPSGFNESLVASGMPRPMQMAFAPDGRLFVTLQSGRVRVIKNGTMLPAYFVDLQSVIDTASDRGMSGIAFDPDFANSPYVYLFYTVKGTSGNPSFHRVSRFLANGDVAVAGSEDVLLNMPSLSSNALHNGGALNFGPDDKLYITTGDNVNLTYSQSLSTTFGKVLRINRDGSIPTDNPFYTSTSGQNRAIWALGLRNPFTAAFRPNTNALYINDVGASQWEEINKAEGGENFGWSTTEGTFSASNYPQFTNPIATYAHGTTNTTGCSIVGAAFYRPAPQVQQFPAEYHGQYFYGEHCQGWIRVLDPATNQTRPFATGINRVIDLEVGPDGSLYYIKRDPSLPSSSHGSVVKISYSRAPAIVTHPSDVTVLTGQTASFSVEASGSTPLSYQWQRNNTNISGATSRTYSFSADDNDNGARFRVVVSNALGSVTSNQATLTITNNQTPAATIVTPAEGTLYQAGKSVSFSGTGSDPEDGNLPASAFTWEVVFHHNDHTHAFLEPFSGVKNGSFVVPNTGELDPNVWYRIHLTVEDSSGLTHSTYRDVLPQLSTIKLQTLPAGMQVTLDGPVVDTPHSASSVVGIRRTLGHVSPQTFNGTTWEFDSWSDNGSATHTIVTNKATKTYTALYRVAGGSVGTGTGLSATYFDNKDLTSPIKSQVNQTINYNWGTGAPTSGVGPDTFSVRWTGQIQGQFSETYKFYTVSNDGVRLWIDDQLVIDNWTNHSTTENSATVTLNAGTLYNIRLEYYDNTGNARISLSWSSPSTPKNIVPRSQLYPATSSMADAPFEAEPTGEAPEQIILGGRTE